MDLAKEIWFLLEKELRLEWRQKYAISGILLYVCSTIFITYLAALELEVAVWNSLFWIIVLFASINAVLKSFGQENSNRQLYYYTLVRPLAVILSKMLYNFLLLLLLSFLAYGVFSLFHPSPVEYFDQFFIAIFLGGLGFSITLTFIAAIAAKAANSSTLLAILGFPVIIPILMSVLRISRNALALTQNTIQGSINTLIAMDLMLLAAALVLFPYLWRD